MNSTGNGFDWLNPKVWIGNMCLSEFGLKSYQTSEVENIRPAQTDCKNIKSSDSYNEAYIKDCNKSLYIHTPMSTYVIKLAVKKIIRQ